MQKRRLARFLISLRLVSTVFGAILILTGAILTLGSFNKISTLSHIEIGTVAYFALIISLIFFGLILVLSYPTTYRVKFVKPSIRSKGNPSYGIWIMIGLGVGSTLGSPLFLLIPENAVQYGFISVISLLLAALISFGMAKVYSDVYAFHARNGKDIVGGPTFIREAYGRDSLKYFVSRTSMWVANSSLSAYCIIIFYDFLYIILPNTISSGFLGGYGEPAIVYTILFMIVIWFIINAFYEERFLVAIGRIQLILVIIMASILIGESLLIFGPHLNFARFYKVSFGSNWIFDLFINTGYLYILFFGFQEIMAFQREVKEEITMKLLFINKKIKVKKATILKVSMFLTVLISSSINILYSASVMLSGIATGAIETATIPAFYIAQSLQGYPGLFFLIVAFLIATITTFTPAFLAASRHLKALGEDKIFPYSVSRVSWVFTLLFIIVLVSAGENFLLSITDFMVLISLGLIVFSGFNYRSQLGRRNGILFPLMVSGLTLFFAVMTYFIDPIVVLFAVIVIVFSYLIHDLISMERISLRLFSGFFEIVLFLVISLLMISYNVFQSVKWNLIYISAVNAGTLALILLLIAGILSIFDGILELYAISSGSK